MKWLRARRDEVAERRLNDLAKRQERVAAEMTQIRLENGFIRQVREALGPVR